jgi:hypothetical protein
VIEMMRKSLDIELAVSISPQGLRGTQERIVVSAQRMRSIQVDQAIC